MISQYCDFIFDHAQIVIKIVLQPIQKYLTHVYFTIKVGMIMVLN